MRPTYLLSRNVLLNVRSKWVFFFFAGLLGLLSPTISWAKIRIAVLDSGVGSTHEQKILEIFKSELKNSNEYEWVSFPIYSSKGELVEKKFLQSLDRASQNFQIIHLSWNMPATPAFKKIIEKLQQLSEKSIVVAASGETQAAAAGSPARLQPSVIETVMGQVPKALLVAELSAAHKMPHQAFRGPQILTALVAPTPDSGSSFSAAVFSARLAKAWAMYNSKNKPLDAQQVLVQIKKNRELSPDPFPSLDDLLKLKEPAQF